MISGGEVCGSLGMVGEGNFGEVCFSSGGSSCLLIDYNVTHFFS